MDILKRKWPWVSRKEHAKALSQLRDEHTRELHEKERTLDAEKWDLRQVIQNLSQISLVHDHARDRWRIVLDVTREVAAAFERGNDERMIDYVVDSIARHLKHEIVCYNIMRPEDVGLGRPGARRSVYDPGPWIEGSFYPDPKCEDKE